MTETNHSKLASAPSRGDHTRRFDLMVLAAVAVVLRLPALFATRHLTFDDGVYGASAVAMRDGGLPFRDVFSSQGPLFLPLVWVADLAGLHTLNGPRLLGLVSGVVLTLAVYLAARLMTDRWGALLAAGLATSAGSMLWVTGPIASDGPALAASAVAVWWAIRYRREPSLRLAVGIGLAAGAALSIKLTTLPVLVPVAWSLLAVTLPGRQGDDRPSIDRVGATRLAASAGFAALVFVVPAVAFGFSDVWDQAVSYHSEVSSGREPLHNISKVASTFADRDLVLLLFAGLTACWAATARHRNQSARVLPEDADRHTMDARVGGPGFHPSRLARSPDPALIAGWLVACCLMLLYIHPLWRPHVSTLVMPVALLVGSYRPPPRVAAIAAIVLIPIGLWRVSGYLVPGGPGPTVVALSEHLDALPDGAWVISDEPGLVWRAGRRTPDDLVDTSILRIDAGRITSDSLVDAAADDRVCALIVWAPVRFGSFSELPERLSDVGYVAEAEFGNDRLLYVKEDCRPPG